MTPRVKRLLWTWGGFAVAAWLFNWANENDHDTLAMWLVLLLVVLYSAQRLIRYGDAATASKCSYCRGRVKAGAIACSKCGRVVRESAVGT